MNKAHKWLALLLGHSLLQPVFAESLPTATDGRQLLPAYFLEVPESVTEILVAETDAATMHRFVMSPEGIAQRDERYMSIGTAGAGKQRAWDRKTPLGVYFITESLDTSKLHDKYGVAAFPLDYPNAWDRYNERTGYGIWLHGVDHKNPQRPPLDTDGCLALPNDELLLLTDNLKPLVTPVVVARNLKWVSPEDLDVVRVAFRRALDEWGEAQQSGDLYAYLSMYDTDFRYQDMDRDAWASYRYNTFSARKLDGVTLSDVMLVADPEVPDLYLSRFTQTLQTNHGPVSTMKRLYWRRVEGEWKIIAEDAG